MATIKHTVGHVRPHHTPSFHDITRNNHDPLRVVFRATQCVSGRQTGHEFPTRISPAMPCLQQGKTVNVFKSQQVPLKSNYRALPTAPVHGVSTTNHSGLHGAVEAVVLYRVWRRGLHPPHPRTRTTGREGARKLRQPPCVFLSLTLQVGDEWLHSKRRAGHGMVMVRCRHVLMVYVSWSCRSPGGSPASEGELSQDSPRYVLRPRRSKRRKGKSPCVDREAGHRSCSSRGSCACG